MNTELMKGFYFGLLAMTVIAVTFWLIFKQTKKSNSSTEIEATTIQKSIENISKLMVIESQFSEVYSYHEKTKIFFDLIPQEKKALIVLNAKAQVGYDLKQLKFEIDKESKQLIITHIPKEEINITPDLKFYDIQSSTFTSFKSEDINKVQKDANNRILEQIEKSDIKIQAKLRLLENLNSITTITNAVGWKMVDKTNQISLLKH